MTERLQAILVHRRTRLVAGALVCFLAAAFFLLVAADVRSWNDALREGDVHYTIRPDEESLWSADERLPTGIGRALAGVEDDVELREAIRALRLARLEDGTVSDPELALRRNEALARLEAIANRAGEDPVRRSRAAGLLGVLGLARLASETQDRIAILESTITSLQQAVNLDPLNADAKFNLELTLQRGRGVQLTEGAGGANPAPGGAGASGAGAGDPGSGY
jgi:hypothetical protein